MVMRQGDYRDPLEILIKREEYTCKGCKHEAVVFDRKYCAKDKKFGKKCKLYEEK